MARRKKEHEMLEKEIQQKGKEHAYKIFGEYHPRDNPGGLLKIIKLTMLGMYGEAGWPDHLVMVRKKPIPVVFFIEVKRESGECTDIQIERHMLLRTMGFEVYVAAGLTRYKQIVEQAVNKALGKRWRPDVPMHKVNA